MNEDEETPPIPPDEPIDEEPIRKIIAECEREARIRYLYNDGFFKPDLRGINYLEVGHSRIVSNPFTIFLEWLHVQFKWFRDALWNLDHRLFPRPSKIYTGDDAPSRTDSRLVGQIVFPFRDQADAVPIHHLRVEFWARTYGFQWRKLATGITNADGYFELPFYLRAARSVWVRSLQFEIHRPAHVYFRDNLPEPGYEIFQTIPVVKSDLTGMRYNLRTIPLPFWLYRTDTNMPRVVLPENGVGAPEVYATGREDAFVQQMIPVELTKAKHLEQIALAPGTLTHAEIQADYPANLTVLIEKRLPGYTRGDEWFGERMMNGMNRGYFQPDPDEPGHYWIKYFGVCNYDSNDVYALPNAEVKFALRDNGLPLPVEIHLTGPLNAFQKDPRQKRVIKSTDGPDWLHAKRVVRVNGAFCTEVDEHFTGTHLNIEQYAIAAYRNLRLNPVAFLLLPHLKEVTLINHAADKSLIQEYIPSATAMTHAGLLRRAQDLLGVQDWRGWKPMAILSPAHTSAQAENLFWDVVTEYVDKFVAENEDGIRRQWLEIYRFSQDLIGHAVPVFGSAAASDNPDDDLARTHERLEYYSGQYSFDPELPRERICGVLRTVSPITHSATFEEAAPGDWQNLKDVCRYAIMMATYMHTWINEHQYDDLGEVMYSCGGLRFGEQETGILAPESDLSIAPDLTRSTQMLWFTNFLSRTEYGFITRNEEGDVNPLFICLLTEKKDAFQQLKVDINAIESRTNI